MIVSRGGSGNYAMVPMGEPEPGDAGPTEPSGNQPSTGSPGASDALSVDAVPEERCSYVNFYPYNCPVYVFIFMLSLGIALMVSGSRTGDPNQTALGILCMAVCIGVLGRLMYYSCISDST